MSTMDLSDVSGRHYRPALTAAFMERARRNNRIRRQEQEERRKIAEAERIKAEQQAEFERRVEEAVERTLAEREARKQAEANQWIFLGAPNMQKFASVMRRACRVFKVTKEEILGPRKAVPVALARQFVMYWTVRRTNWSLPAIGMRLGKDHTTVLHGKDTYVAKRAKQGRTLRKAR